MGKTGGRNRKPGARRGFLKKALLRPPQAPYTFHIILHTVRMRPSHIIFSLLTLPLLAAGCSETPATPSPTPSPSSAPAPSAPSAQTTDPDLALLRTLPRVDACTQLTQEKAATIFPGNTFSLKDQRPAGESGYEILSACYWIASTTQPVIPAYVDLTSRTNVSEKRATDFLATRLDLARESGRTYRLEPSLGKDAFVTSHNVYGVRTIIVEFVKGTTYYELKGSATGKEEAAIANALITFAKSL